MRPGKLARRLIIALIIGVLADAAIMLQVKGWTTLGSEAGGACGTSDQGVSLDPAYSLEEVNAATGTLRSLGYFTQGILQSGQSGLYAFGADDLVVNTTGDSGGQPPLAAIKVPAARR